MKLYFIKRSKTSFKFNLYFIFEKFYLFTIFFAVNAMEYMTDTGGGEMDQSQNGDIVIGPQPDPHIGIQDADMEEDEARSEATFKFSVHQFSKLKVERFLRNALSLK